MMENNPTDCPFCGAKENGEYNILLHVETFHAEGESPFIIKDGSDITNTLEASNDSLKFVECPVQACGEMLLLTELDTHIDLHNTLDQDSILDPTSIDWELQEPEPDTNHPRPGCFQPSSENFKTPKSTQFAEQITTPSSWKDVLKFPNVRNKGDSGSGIEPQRRRLGKAELGPYANEKQMPTWLVRLLAADGEIKSINTIDSYGKLRKLQVCVNQASGVIPVLRQLFQQDPLTKEAYLCNPAVLHVSKLKREGGFCGYRNIQMLSSYIIGAKAQGYEVFNNKMPTIFDIQDHIENAWDLGINSHGKIETGGIRGTRKYIGTPDAQAMFCSLGIACDAQGFRSKPGQPPAYRLLLDALESYFANGVGRSSSKVNCTSLPPIYFQHPGHSMTIIGFQRRMDNSISLIVFDSMFQDSSGIIKRVGQTFLHKAPTGVLRAYLRDLKYLKKYSEFEILKLSSSKK